MNRKKLTIYFDMDGVLANFDKRCKEIGTATPWLDTKGFFRDLQPIGTPNDTIQLLQQLGYTVHVLTKVDNRGAIGQQRAVDKLNWIREHIPSLSINNAIIVPIDEDKTSYIKSDLSTSVLVDDYKVNLLQWQDMGGISVKFGNKFKNTRNYFQIVGDIFNIIPVVESLEMGVMR